jgi:multiple sugar transport system substrate-binding protein
MGKNRVFAITALLLAIALTLGACQTKTPEPAKEEVVTLLWAFWGSPAEAETHRQVADAFTAEHPNIKIETMVEPWSDYFTKVQTLWASGDASVIPDVLFLWPTPRYAAEGVLENLDPWIEKSGYDLADYWPALLE